MVAATLGPRARKPLVRASPLHPIEVLLRVRANLGGRPCADVGGDTRPITVEQTEALHHARMLERRPHGARFGGSVGLTRASGRCRRGWKLVWVRDVYEMCERVQVVESYRDRECERQRAARVEQRRVVEDRRVGRGRRGRYILDFRRRGCGDGCHSRRAGSAGWRLREGRHVASGTHARAVGARSSVVDRDERSAEGDCLCLYRSSDHEQTLAWTAGI
jgi:hypothetical protein